MLNQKIIRIFIASLTLISVALLSAPNVLAGSLGTIYDRLDRAMQNQLTLGTHNLVFTTAGAVNASGGGYAVLKLQFPLAQNGQWCRTAGTDLAVTTSTEDSSTGLVGTLSGQCTQGDGGTTYDTIYICATGALANWLTTTKYGVIVADGSTGKLGTKTLSPSPTTTASI